MLSRIFHGFLMCLLLTFSALGVSSCSTSTSGGQPFSQDVQDKLNSAVDAKMAEFGVPGVIVGVWVPGKGEWISCKGAGDITTGAGPTIPVVCEKATSCSGPAEIDTTIPELELLKALEEESAIALTLDSP